MDELKRQMIKYFQGEPLTEVRAAYTIPTKRECLADIVRNNILGSLYFFGDKLTVNWTKASAILTRISKTCGIRITGQLGLGIGCHGTWFIRGNLLRLKNWKTELDRIVTINVKTPEANFIRNSSIIWDTIRCKYWVCISIWTLL